MIIKGIYDKEEEVKSLGTSIVVEYNNNYNLECYLVNPQIEHLIRDREDRISYGIIGIRYLAKRYQWEATIHEISGKYYLQGDRTRILFDNGLKLPTKVVRDCYMNRNGNLISSSYKLGYLFTLVAFIPMKNNLTRKTEILDMWNEVCKHFDIPVDKQKTDEIFRWLKTYYPSVFRIKKMPNPGIFNIKLRDFSQIVSFLSDKIVL